MIEQTIPAYEDGEIILLDFLDTLAESWRLLVIGPIVAGVLAGGLSFLWPKTFESEAVVRMFIDEVALLHSAPVLDQLIENFGLLAEADGIVDDARQGLKARLTFAVDNRAKQATITAKGRTPDAAQALGSAAIVLVVNELQVKGQDRVLLEKTMAINTRAIASAEDVIDSIRRSLKRAGASYQIQESAIKSLAVLNVEIVNLSKENEVLRNKLESKGSEVYVQEASLAQRKASPKRSLVVMLAILASGFALLIFVYVRKAWAQAAQNVESAGKLASIKRSFSLQKI
jgi:hypothetical protein